MAPRRPDRTRERILDAAAELVREAPAEFTIDRVAAAAGVSRATVYRRFSRAEELVEALGGERGVEGAADRVDARSRILDAAKHRFAADGIAGTTLSAIAEAAGVSVSTLYNHFDDKEALVTALLGELGPVSLFPKMDLDGVEPERALRTFVRGALGLGRAHAELFRLLLSPDPVTRRAFARVRTGAGGLERSLGPILMKVGLRRDVSPEDAVVLLMGMIFSTGIFIPMMTATPVEDPDAAADRITRIFLDGVRDRGGRNPTSDRP